MSEDDRIGLYGGTFDPFHYGHLAPVLEAFKVRRWSRLIYVPAFVQPFKQDRVTSAPWHRWAMTLLGAESDARLSVSSMELDRPEVSYTVDTLETVRREHPGATLDWIVGDDNLPLLSSWRSIDRIFELSNFVVLTRAVAEVPDGYRSRIAEASDASQHGRIIMIHNTTVDVSSTEVRRRVAAGEPVTGLVPPRIERYIQTQALYRPEVSN